MATHLSATNGINLTALMVTDNQSYADADYQLHTPQTINQESRYSTPLPNERNISFMEDNDLRDGSSLLSFPVYFGPFKYGSDMQESIINVNSNNMNDSVRVFWDVVAYLAPLTVQERNGPVFTRGYLSYIIALAAVFLVGKHLTHCPIRRSTNATTTTALFAGVIFLRWWRVRQLREQMDYETQLNAHAYNMQMRMQAKPLPVDVVNALPITRYTPGQIKNGSCAICLDDFEEGETDIRILGCGHGFCVLCIGKCVGDVSHKKRSTHLIGLQTHGSHKNLPCVLFANTIACHPIEYAMMVTVINMENHHMLPLLLLLLLGLRPIICFVARIMIHRWNYNKSLLLIQLNNISIR